MPPAAPTLAACLARHAVVGAARLPSSSVVSSVSFSATTHGRIEAEDGNTSWQHSLSQTESADPSYDKLVARQILTGVHKPATDVSLRYLAQNQASSQKSPSTLDTDTRGPVQICSQPFKVLDKLYKQIQANIH